MSRFIHGRTKDAQAWLRDQLGLDPTRVSRVEILIDHAEAVTAEITYLLGPEQLAALELEDVRPTEPA